MIRDLKKVLNKNVEKSTELENYCSLENVLSSTITGLLEIVKLSTKCEVPTPVKECTSTFIQTMNGKFERRTWRARNLLKLLEDKFTKIVFIGNISSGKSMLINSLLGKEILLSSVGKTTTRVVEITFTPEDQAMTNTAAAGDDVDDRLENLQDMLENESTAMGTGQGQEPMRVDLDPVLCRPEWVPVDGTLMLVDCPGYDGDSKCRQTNSAPLGHVTVVVTVSGIGQPERDMLDTVLCSRVGLLVAVNKWDQASENDSDEGEQISRNMISADAAQWTGHDLNSVFFLSASEQLRDQQQAPNGRQFRDAEFGRFRAALQSLIANWRDNKDTMYANDAKEISTEIEKDWKIFTTELQTIRERRRKVKSHITELLKSLQNTNDGLQTKIDNRFDELRSKLKEDALDINGAMKEFADIIDKNLEEVDKIVDSLFFLLYDGMFGELNETAINARLAELKETKFSDNDEVNKDKTASNTSEESSKKKSKTDQVSSTDEAISDWTYIEQSSDSNKEAEDIRGAEKEDPEAESLKAFVEYVGQRQQEFSSIIQERFKSPKDVYSQFEKLIN